MLMLFDTAADALGFAMDYHAALAALPAAAEARAGLHVGPVILRDQFARGRGPWRQAAGGGGLAKPLAARVMSLARAGRRC